MLMFLQILGLMKSAHSCWFSHLTVINDGNGHWSLLISRKTFSSQVFNMLSKSDILLRRTHQALWSKVFLYSRSIKVQLSLSFSEWPHSPILYTANRQKVPADELNCQHHWEWVKNDLSLVRLILQEKYTKNLEFSKLVTPDRKLRNWESNGPRCPKLIERSFLGFPDWLDKVLVAICMYFRQIQIEGYTINIFNNLSGSKIFTGEVQTVLEMQIISPRHVLTPTVLRVS